MNIVKRPQFLFTYYNPFDSHKDNLGNTFLDYVKDVNLANYSSQVVGKFIEQQTEEQLRAINNLSTELSMIGEDIRYGFNKINQRLTLIQVEQFNTNLLLKDIKHILKQPDSEKQRMKHIELGIKFFNQALKNEDLILDAVEEFDKAFALMKQDWFTSYQLGLCHTYYKAVQDLGKAETYFLNAAKYASVDTLVVNDFNEVFYQSISLTKYNNNLYGFVTECYLQVALIKYIQADFVAAVNYAKKATSLSPNSAKAFFLLAKYESRVEQDKLAIESLKIANSLDSNIHKVFPNDIDILKNYLFADFYSTIKAEKLMTIRSLEMENNIIDDHIRVIELTVQNHQNQLNKVLEKIEINKNKGLKCHNFRENVGSVAFVSVFITLVVGVIIFCMTKFFDNTWGKDEGTIYWFFSLLGILALAVVIIPIIYLFFKYYYNGLLISNESEEKTLKLEAKEIESKIARLYRDIKSYQSKKHVITKAGL